MREGEAAARLWGWLDPNHPDRFAADVESWLAGRLGLADLTADAAALDPKAVVATAHARRCREPGSSFAS